MQTYQNDPRSGWIIWHPLEAVSLWHEMNRHVCLWSTHKIKVIPAKWTGGSLPFCLEVAILRCLKLLCFINIISKIPLPKPVWLTNAKCGRHVDHELTHKKVSRSHPWNDTESLPFYGHVLHFQGFFNTVIFLTVHPVKSTCPSWLKPQKWAKMPRKSTILLWSGHSRLVLNICQQCDFFFFVQLLKPVAFCAKHLGRLFDWATCLSWADPQKSIKKPMLKRQRKSAVFGDFQVQIVFSPSLYL